MEGLLVKGEKQVQMLENDMLRLHEVLSDPSSTSSQRTPIFSDINAGLSTTGMTLRRLDEHLSRESNKERHKLAKDSIRRLRARSDKIRKDLDEQNINSSTSQYLSQKDHLLPHTTTSTSNAQQEQEWSINNASNRLQDFISTGSSILAQLRDQKSTFKQTQRQLLDASGSLDIGKNLLKAIGRKSNGDKIIFYLLVAVTFLFIVVVWRLLRS